MAFDNIYHYNINIPHRFIINFLEINGWACINKLDDGSLIYYSNEFNAEIIVPTDTTYSDFSDVIFGIIIKLANFYNIRPDIQVSNIIYRRSDRFKFNISGANSKFGTIPFTSILSYTESLRKWLLSGAAFAINPRKHHKKLVIKETEEWLSRCRMGQTEFGSYILNIIFPIEPQKKTDDGQFMLTDDIPLTRKITNTLIHSASVVKEAIDEDDIERITSDSSSIMTSSNLCSALIEMQDSSKSSNIKILVDWDRSVQQNIKNIPRLIEFSQSYRSVLEDIVKELTPLTPLRTERYSGFVVKLSKDQGSDFGTISLQAMVNKKRRNICVQLESDDYTKAIDAHKKFIPVFISGVLEDVNGRLHLNSVTDFSIAVPEGQQPSLLS